MNAFPNPHRTDMLGMTLRDYFAAKAMQALCADPEWAQAKFGDVFNTVEIKTYSYSGEIKFTKEETPDAAQ